MVSEAASRHLGGDCEQTRVVAVLFEWANDRTDLLISFRGPSQDKRPVTGEEATVIRSCGPDNNIDSVDWQKRLPPGRKFSWVQRQAQALGISCKTRKPTEWVQRGFQTNIKSWSDLHP